MWEKLGFAREHELENGRGNGAEEGIEEFVPVTAAFEEGRKTESGLSLLHTLIYTYIHNYI